MRRFYSVVWLLISLPAAMVVPPVSMAQIISITIAPPELPVYEQPALPALGYIWAPGYWAYGPGGYFWVPGTWVQPPSVGLLWTPGYWGWRDGVYRWNAGYWGPHIGFYGGVNYGFGYGGVGYEGGYWNNGVFAYNRTVNNFGGVTVTNVYNKTVIVNTSVTRASFNGGTGGTTAQPTPQEQAATREQHVAATPMQTEHEHTASTNKALLATVNNGHPAIAATSKPGDFTGKGVVAAREAKPSTLRPGLTPTSTGAIVTPPQGQRRPPSSQPLPHVAPPHSMAPPPQAMRPPPPPPQAMRPPPPASQAMRPAAPPQAGRSGAPACPPGMHFANGKCTK